MDYIDVLEKKPLSLKIDGKLYQFHGLTVKEMVSFTRQYKYLFAMLKQLEGKQGLSADILNVQIHKRLALLVWKHTKKRIGKRKFINYLMDHIDVLIEVYDKILSYNAEVKKKAQRVAEYDIWAAQAMPTIGGRFLSDYIQTDETGKKCFKPRYSLS